MGRDLFNRAQYGALLISIHAPAWGATCPRRRARALRRISIHAPAWGATKTTWTRYVGSQISIHAPAWGATLYFLVGGYGSSFQSTRPRGARHNHPLRRAARHRISIHAPAWGATWPQISSAARLRYFNPRARVGRDDAAQGHLQGLVYFNPRACVGRDQQR